MALWFFVRESEGVWSKLSLPRYVRFFEGEEGLPCEGGHVVLCQASLEFWERKPVALLEVQLRKTAVGAGGRVKPADRGLTAKSLEALFLVQSGAHVPKRRPDGTVDASGLFRLRRIKAKSEWRPSRVDAEGLRAAINRRAGWPIADP
jgi:hypothetical protein